MSFYEKLGVKRVINCVSTTSPLGSSIVHPEVMEVMEDASTFFVCVDDLQDKAGQVIAELTGSEAAIVTSGCAAALTIGTAACMMKATPLEKCALAIDRPPHEPDELLNWLQRLPNDVEGLKNEIVIQKCHLNKYSQSHRVAGAKLVLAGSRKQCTFEGIESRVNDRTAAIAFVGMYAHKGVTLEDVLRIARRQSVPVLMDASYTLPPRINLKRWASMGVNLVCYSGGKAIRGPTDTGILCGSKDLVTLAAIQMSPHHGVGRGFKVDKTQIVGLLKALDIFLKQGDDEEFAHYLKKAEYLVEQLKDIPGVDRVETIVPATGLLRTRPVVILTLNEDLLNVNTKVVVDLLYAGNPGIWTYYDHHLCPGGITMNTQNILEGEENTVVERFKAVLSQ